MCIYTRVTSRTAIIDHWYAYNNSSSPGRPGARPIRTRPKKQSAKADSEERQEVEEGWGGERGEAEGGGDRRAGGRGVKRVREQQERKVRRGMNLGFS